MDLIIANNEIFTSLVFIHDCFLLPENCKRLWNPLGAPSSVPNCTFRDLGMWPKGRDCRQGGGVRGLTLSSVPV